MNTKRNISESPSEMESLWKKCPSCDQIIYKKELIENLKICPKCGHYLRMNARERIDLLVDRDEKNNLMFKEFDKELISLDPLKFYESSSEERADKKQGSFYLSKISVEQKKTENAEAIVCGRALIGGTSVILSVMDFEFMGGSMGSVVGEKATRGIEQALESKIPFVIVSASGGARMQEGILSLMQMAKTSAALSRLHEASLPCISILCDPTTGGVTASFAMLGDVHIAEPKALIAFAGPRVIEQTLRQTLPEGFQQAEFLLKHGMIDCIVDRKDLKNKLVSILKFFQPQAS